MAAARKKKKKHRRKASPTSTRCKALIVVDSSRIRRKHMGACKRARTTFKKAEQELDAYETRDKPAFSRWYYSVAGSPLTEIKSLSHDVQALYEKMRRLAQFARMAVCRPDEAAHLLEHSPEVFAQREQAHVERIRRQAELRRRKLEKQREAIGRSVRSDFGAFLESYARRVRALLRDGASAKELLWELIFVFCDDRGHFPPDVTMALKHPEGVALLEGYGFTLNTDLDDDDDDDFEPDFGSGSDAFEPYLDVPRQKAWTESDEARLKSLRRDLAFALHPDQSDSGSDPAKLELWHQVQEAVEARDLDRLEVLHAHWQMLSGDLSPRASVSRVMALTEMYRRSRGALRRRIRALRQEPEWGFSTLNEEGRERMRKRLMRDLHAQREQLRVDMADARAVYRRNFAPPRASQAKRRPPPVRERPVHPGQVEFELF